MNSFELSICEREPIHIPGCIQPHGIALSYNLLKKIITGFSSNFPNNKTLIGLSLYQVLPDTLVEKLSLINEQSSHKLRPIYKQKIKWLGLDYYDVIHSRSGDEIMVEFVLSSQNKNSDYMQLGLGEIVEQILKCRSIEEICNQAALDVEAISGYDRVMVYRFDSDFNGCVVAEKKHSHMEPYLGLHYPASDIPSQARELFRKNIVRCIVDVDYHPLSFVHDSMYSPLDMTYSYLRSASPVHVEYLKNMGVQSTMTISILIDGELWGLIACHHRLPHQLSLEDIALVEEFGRIIAGILKIQLEGEEQKRSVQLNSTLEAIVTSIQTNQNEDGLISILSRNSELFYSLFDVSGFAFFLKDESITFNTCCEKRELLELKDRIIPLLKNGSFFTSHLVEILPNISEKILTECSGLLMIEIPSVQPSYWLWVRREKNQMLTWGGNPHENKTINKKGGISPRTSFSAFKEIIRYKSDHWENSEIAFVEHFTTIIMHLFEVFETEHKMGVQKKKIQEMQDEKLLHYKQLLESLVDLIEQRDAYTAGHTRRVARYCDMIAEKIGLSANQRAQLVEAAVLHDIGKIVVPDAILLKPGRLNKIEFDLIKMHATSGYQILKRILYYEPLAEIIRYHHEKYDGSGYPEGIKEDMIPLSSHIMIVADALDAMTSNRIYQAKRTMAEAINEIVSYKGIWYHPDVVDAAVVALATFDEDTVSTQLPISQTEKARLSYYFKDQLTGVHNEFYLQMIIDRLVPEVTYSYYFLVEIKKMTSYNTYHGWHAGNNLIHTISEKLQLIIPNEQIFRVFGDDFVIGCHSLEEVKSYMKRLSQNNDRIEMHIRELEVSDLMKMLNE